MSAEDLERYEADMELQLYQEYRDVLGMFQYVIETERRFYLANKFDLQMRNQDGDTYFDITLHDAWVWDMYRPARFVTRVRVVTFKDVNIEELIRKEELWPILAERGIHGVQRDPAVPGQEDGRHCAAGRGHPDRPGPAGLGVRRRRQLSL